MIQRLLVCVVLVTAMLTFTPTHSSGASKEIMELQRDVATLQDMVKAMQRSQDEKLSGLQVLVQQSLNAANEANKSVAVIQSGFQQSLRDQEAKVVTPVVGLGSRMDQVSNDLHSVSQAVSDLASMMSSLKSQLSDMNNAIKVMGTTPAAPPGAQGSAPGGQPETPPISSKELYDNALRDRNGGKFALALEEFANFLKWYGTNDLAPNAQYYIAYIHSAQGDYENAVKEYDMVLEKYPDNNKTPDAMFGKGSALLKLGRRTEGGNEFRELIKKFPRHDLSTQACDQLKAMGYNSCGSPRAAAPTTKGGATKRKK